MAAPHPFPTSLAVADLTGLRRPAFVLGLSNGSVVAVDGNSGRVLARCENVLQSSPGVPIALSCSDFDADGRCEVAVAPAVPVEEPSLVVLRLSDTNDVGRFEMAASLPLDKPLFKGGASIASGCFGPARSSRWIAVAPKSAANEIAPSICFYKLSSSSNTLIEAALPITPSFAAPGVVHGFSLAVGPVRGDRFFSELLIAPFLGLGRSTLALEAFALHAQPDNAPLLPIFTRAAPLLETSAAQQAAASLPSFTLVGQIPVASLPPALVAACGGWGLGVAVCASTNTHGAVVLFPSVPSAPSSTLYLFYGFALPPPTPISVEVLSTPFVALSLAAAGAGVLFPQSQQADGKKPVPGPAKPSLVAFCTASGSFALLTPARSWIPLDLGAAAAAGGGPTLQQIPGWRSLSGKEAGPVGSSRLLGWEEGFYGRANPYCVELSCSSSQSAAAQSPLLAALAATHLTLPSSHSSSFTVPLDANSPLLTSMSNPMALVDSDDATSWGPHSSPSPLAFPRPTLKQMASQGPDWVRQRIVAHALALCDGLDYQHHHSPFFASQPQSNDAGKRFSTVFAARHTQGLDCSNLTSFIFLSALGLKISSAISEQAEQAVGDLNAPLPSARGTNKAISLPRIHAQRVPLPQAGVNGPPVPFEAMVAMLRPGDLLYLQKGAKGTPRDKPIGHVVLWVGPVLGRKKKETTDADPSSSSPSSYSYSFETCPLFIDSHGGSPPISDGNLVTPFGPALRELRPDSWYHDRFSHAVRWIHDQAESSCPLWDSAGGSSGKLQRHWATAAASGAGATARHDEEDEGDEAELYVTSSGAGAVPVPLPGPPATSAPIFLPPPSSQGAQPYPQPQPFPQPHHQPHYQPQQQDVIYPPPAPAFPSAGVAVAPSASQGCSCVIM